MAMAMIKDIRACQDYGIATVCAADGADGRWLAHRRRLLKVRVLQKCAQEQQGSPAESTCAYEDVEPKGMRKSEGSALPCEVLAEFHL